MIISIYWSFFSLVFCYVSGILGICLILLLSYFNKSTLYPLYFLLFLLPFSMVLRIPNKSFGFYSLFIAFFVIENCIAWLIKIIKKNKKFNLLTFIPAFVLSLYLFILHIMGNYSLSNCVSFVLGVLFLFVIVENISKIKMKELFLLFIFGLLISCLIGLHYKSYPTLSRFYNITNALGVIRFSALFPNTNAFTMNVLMAIGMISCLYLSGKVDIIFYPLLLLLLIISFSTLSKMTFIVLFVVIVMLFLLRLFCKETKSLKWKSILILAITVILAILIQFNNFKLITKRIVSPFINNEISKNEEYIEEDISNNIFYNDIDYNSINGFTTGRVELWKNCIKKILKNKRTLFFGCDKGKEYNITKTIDGSPHNTYLQITYVTGIIGFVLILILIITYLIYICKKSFNYNGLILFFTIGMCFFSLDAFSYIGFIMISMSLLGLRNNKKEEENNVNT